MFKRYASQILISCFLFSIALVASAQTKQTSTKKWEESLVKTVDGLSKIAIPEGAAKEAADRQSKNAPEAIEANHKLGFPAVGESKECVLQDAFLLNAIARGLEEKIQKESTNKSIKVTRKNGRFVLVGVVDSLSDRRKIEKLCGTLVPRAEGEENRQYFTDASNQTLVGAACVSELRIRADEPTQETPKHSDTKK